MRENKTYVRLNAAGRTGPPKNPGRINVCLQNKTKSFIIPKQHIERQKVLWDSWDGYMQEMLSLPVQEGATEKEL